MQLARLYLKSVPTKIAPANKSRREGISCAALVCSQENEEEKKIEMQAQCCSFRFLSYEVNVRARAGERETERN